MFYFECASARDMREQRACGSKKERERERERVLVRGGQEMP